MIKKLINSVVAHRVIIFDRNRNILFMIPLIFGIIGVIMAPAFFMVGIIVALLMRCTIKIERR